MFESFAGDQLTTFPRDPIVQYRLRRASAPDQVEVLIQGGQADAVAEAKKIYDVPDPDFLQVRTVRGALMERTAKIRWMPTAAISTSSARSAAEPRASRTRPGPPGALLRPNDEDIPFVRVDDNVGDQTDPANFTRIFRIAYYRDGTVRKYVITEAGDSTGALGRPGERGLAAHTPQPGRSGCPARPRRCRRSRPPSPARARSSPAASSCWRSGRASCRPRRAHLVRPARAPV